ncbi:MAG: bifunctional 3-deoxy-7-phosphoheptulonate synthase/chorismate mutase type II [Saprospiraceae bacterium]|nr:bifunctional 3-deoxy-7-phosphoheptulonate synthase/chorismate mutase type II [Saprospiraceae bacterium]
MNIKPVFEKKERPIIIAGPCSAETREQVLQTARDLAPLKIDLYRAGIWKPRTRPDSFEGVGREGLAWLREVKQETGLKVTTEVANREHVFDALKHDIDVLWIGARTTVNPFSIQEIADALQGTNIPVIIKNPINPDLQLWIGAMERFYKAGINQLAVIHRGFSFHGESSYRNVPRWQIPIELKRQFPDLQIICDNSHICGRRDTLQTVAQQALDLNFDGLMTEVHPTPDSAWSDAAQQITPDQFELLLANLIVRQPGTDNPELEASLDQLRHEIDEIDSELLRMLGDRMKLAEGIGEYKKKNNIAILQPQRWNEILQLAQLRGSQYGLSPDFVSVLLKSVHQESINHQNMIMNQSVVDEKS